MPNADHPVERAIAEGKFPESRRAHYMALMAKNPKKTERLMARLASGLLPEESEQLQEFVEGSGHTAPAGARASGPGGPTGYPKEWLSAAGTGQAGGIVGGVPGGRKTITFENDIVAAQSMPGANVPEGLG